MAMLERKKSYVSIKTKLEKIITFCASLGINAKNLIIRNIQEKTDDLSDKCALLIDVLWKSIKGLESGDDKIIIIEAMNILSHVLDMLGIVNPILTLVSYVVQLVAFFLKVIFHLINLKKILEPKITPNDTLRHELAGLAERIQRTVIFIDAVDDEEHVEEATLQGLISNVDIHIGVDQLGNLKSRIKTFMSGGKEDWRTCLELLKMFVRISTLRHALLFRMLTCLRAKDYSRGTVIALQKYIEIERKDNQTFLGFFSLPTLENVGILAFFNPSDEDELLTYLEKLRLSFQNLRVVLHEQMFFITQKNNPNILWGRPLASVCSVRAIKSCSTDVQNRRIRFKFVAIENEFNLFHIQSPDSDDYVFMKENSYCKYSKSVKDPDTAKWRVILVHDTDEKEEAHSCFTLCTKKWPEKFVFMEDTFFKSARGLGINSKPSMECLFTLTPPGESPISVKVANPGSLTVTVNDVKEKVKNHEESPNKISVPIQENALVPFNKEHTTLKNHEESRNTISVPIEENVSVVFHEEHKTVSDKTLFHSTRKQTNSSLETISIFLKERKIDIERDIRRIENYILENRDDPLNAIFERISENVLKLDEQNVTDEVLMGLVEMLSISFELFHTGKFLYGSILRQVLRICGLVMSCFWQISGIDADICSSLEDDQKGAIYENISKIQNFASYLHEIECSANILEKDIRDMKRSGAFCEELSQTQLRERSKKNPKLILTYVKLSILQQTILWQMYAVAKQPGHSEKIANHLHRMILSQKGKDVSFLTELPDGIETVLVNKYSTCLGCQLQMSESKEVVKLTMMQKLKRMSLIVVPLLHTMLFKRVESELVSKIP